mmetsp:Transcript_14844/g.43865  ORF Transcript_14844/g.43865 Transcript_14844/m.43865 type:complete len:303 (-) Transcript_14844:285-1193(-)
MTRSSPLSASPSSPRSTPPPRSPRGCSPTWRASRRCSSGSARRWPPRCSSTPARSPPSSRRSCPTSRRSSARLIGSRPHSSSPRSRRWTRTSTSPATASPPARWSRWRTTPCRPRPLQTTLGPAGEAARAAGARTRSPESSRHSSSSCRIAQCAARIRLLWAAARAEVGRHLQTSLLQMSEALVEQPRAFRPERWLAGAVAERKGTPAELIDHPLLSAPFSAGARKCPGSRVATLEVRALIAGLVHNWRIGLVDERQATVPYRCQTTIAPTMPRLRYEPLTEESRAVAEGLPPRGGGGVCAP